MSMPIPKILLQHYNLHNPHLTPVQSGQSALAYRVEAGDKLYFLKIYDKARYSSQVWIERIDQYMPTVLWLGKYSSLQGRTSHVILTASGNY